MESENYYTVNDTVTEKYFKLPKWLFSETYIGLSNDAKIAYALLKDRNAISVINHWFDEEGRIYFNYTNKKLEDILNLGSTKVKNIKKELILAKLLKVKKMGFSKVTGRNMPSRLYLLKPILNAEDVYNKMLQDYSNIPSTLEQSGRTECVLPNNIPSVLEQSGRTKYVLPKNMSSTLEQSGGTKYVPYQEHILDTNKIHIDTPNNDFESMFSQSKYSEKEIKDQNYKLTHSANEFYTETDNKKNMPLNREGLAFLSAWCHTPVELQKVISILLSAKSNVLEEVRINLGAAKASELNTLRIYDQEEEEQIKYQLTLTLKKVLNCIRVGEQNNKPIRNQLGYLYKAFENFYANYYNDILQARHEAEKNDE